MSSILLLLQRVHQNVHQTVHTLTPKKYSEPRIYTGGVDITLWNQLSKEEQNTALSKDWYIYYKFIDETTGKLKRMPNIKGGANRFKTKKERLIIFNQLRDSLEYLLEKGLNPYTDPDLTLLEDDKPTSTTKPIIVIPQPAVEAVATIEPVVNISDEPVLSIKQAFEYALKIKKKSLNDVSYINYEGRINRFKKYLDENEPITSITRKITNQYLNEILENSSPRNRNNSRIDLSSLFEVLTNDEIIPENFIKKINILKAKPERNKTYTPKMQEDIYSYLESNDPILLLFIKFICYNFLRPVEVCRLKVGDIDIIDKKLYVRAKNKAVKIKIIPEILLKDLPDLSKLNKDHFLFTPYEIGAEWIATENNRRDNFSKKFKTVVKDHFKLGSDYGMYSFRHTFITKLYRELRKSYSPFETKSRLMLITGHSTMTALEQYLRDIDAELPEDYSHMLV
ncbi:tyrosine-type recombinase/integrase [Flavobacterium sp. XS1P27]|uniref:tyrosine-type recombinase/integrase n=1 Tax=Flavobacterium sp. XS1P27 TaxID=3401724 RepID=UPI003AAD959D